MYKVIYVRIREFFRPPKIKRAAELKNLLICSYSVKINMCLGEEILEKKTVSHIQYTF